MIILWEVGFLGGLYRVCRYPGEVVGFLVAVGEFCSAVVNFLWEVSS